MTYDQDSQDEIPDWLNNLPGGDDEKDSTSSDISSEENQPSSQDEELSPAEESESLDDTPSEEDEKAPDWLKNIRDLKSVTGTLSLPSNEDQEEDDWLENLSSSIKSDREADDDDFLEELINEEPETADSKDEEPDWLENIEDDQTKKEEKKGESKEEVSDFPGWLDNVRSKHVEDSQKIEIYENSPEEAPPVEDDPEKVSEESSTPDWLQGIDEQKKEIQSLDDDSTTNKEDLPDWLQDIMSGSKKEKEILDELSEKSEVEITEKVLSPAEEKIKEVKENLEDEEAWVDQFELDGIEIPNDEVLDWLDETNEPAALTTEEPVVITEPQESELPSWLDDIVPETNEEILLTGPLMDLTNPLPLETAIKKIHAPHMPTQDIFLTEIQEKHVEHIFELLKDEDSEQQITDLSPSKPQPFLQIIIAIALILGIVFSVFKEDDVAGPSNTPIYVQDFENEISSLKDDDHVLVAIEYQSAFIGELETSAGVVVKEIINKNAEINFITTNPVGPGLINHLINNQLSDQISSSADFVTGGYIAGDSAGLLYFAENPQESSPIFSKNHPKDISKIEDYDLILIITDDITNARGWLEQVQPKLTDNDTYENQPPILMITSSQLEAIIHPYYATTPKRIDGYISGLRGFSQYQNILGKMTQNDLWNGYSQGVSVAILIILLGSVYQIIQSRPKSKQRSQEI